MNECNGQCCEKLFFPRTPEEIYESYNKWIMTGKSDIDDIDKIGPMLRIVQEDGDLGAWYTCIHYDNNTKMCMIYDKRPQMCRDYPYDSPCVHCGWENKEYQQREVVPPGGIGSPHI